MRTKIKNAPKKHLRRKKSLIYLFAFLCARRKENKKKRKIPTMLSIGAVRWFVKPVWAH